MFTRGGHGQGHSEDGGRRPGRRLPRAPGGPAAGRVASMVAAGTAAVVVVSGLTGLGALTAQAAPTVATTFTVSGVGTNNQISPGPDGTVWVTLDSGAKDVARLSPDGTVTEFDVPDVSLPVGITQGRDRTMWVTQPGSVVRFSADTPEAASTKVDIAGLTSPQAITPNNLGGVSTASGSVVYTVSEAATPTVVATAGTGLVDARGIVNGGASGLWIADFGGAAVVNVVSPGTVHIHPTGGGPQQVAVGTGFVAGYSNPIANPQEVGRIPFGGSAQRTQIGDVDPFGVTFGRDEAFWYAQFGGDSLGRLTLDGAYSSVPLPSGSGPRQITSTADGALWVTLDTADKVARVTGVEPPTPTSGQSTDPQTGGAGTSPTASGSATATPTATPTATSAPPDTRIDAAPRRTVRTSARRARVTFAFSGSPGTTGFQCRLRRAAPFRACASPDSFRLRPGRYVFRVRAVAGDLVDPSPAKRRVTVVRRP